MSDDKTYKQPWLKDATFDGVFILAPPLACLALIALLPHQFLTKDYFPVAAWVILVLLIDVGHVYSTLFRTYFNPSRMQRQPVIYWLIPVCCYLAGVTLHYIDGLLFWRVLAYAAVFHFVRQQYGFLRLYKRSDVKSKASDSIDHFLIYYATLYPLLYWHLSADRRFNWFVEGDFITYPAKWLLLPLTIVYAASIVLYLVKEVRNVIYYRTVNIPKNLLIAGTLLSWYFGIVYYNGDLIFTLLNVVAHGIPYMALIWLTGRKDTSQSTVNKWVFNKRWGLVAFILLIVLFAYMEEGLWDGFIWKEHSSVFGIFSCLPLISNHLFLTLLVPLLALPQATHYVLDGFIWRRKNM